MDTQPPQPGISGSKSSQMAGTSSNTSITRTKQQRGHRLVHRDAATKATKNITQDEQLKIIRKNGSSTNNKQHAVGCKDIHILINGCQLTIELNTGEQRELRDQFIATPNGKSPRSTKAFICTVHKIEHDDVVSSGKFADEFLDENPYE